MPKPPPAGPTGHPVGGAPPVMPPSVRVAVIVMAVLAALLLSNAALLGFGFDIAVDRIVRDADGITRAEAERFVLASLVPYLALGLVLALAAVLVPRRHRWARWAGVAAAALLALLTLTAVLAAGGIGVVSLLLLVLAVAAGTSLLAPTTGAWTAGVER